MDKAAKEPSLFSDIQQRKRYLCALVMILLMTLGACAGGLIVLYSPFSLVVNIAIVFSCAAVGLLFTRASLYPLISACVLPVLLKTESWVYPLSVFVMTLVIIAGQRWMEYIGLRKSIFIIDKIIANEISIRNKHSVNSCQCAFTV